MMQDDHSKQNHSFSEDKELQEVHDQLLKEKESPKEGFPIFPILILGLFAGLIFWGGIYVSRYAGHFRSDIYDPHWEPGQESTAEIAFDPMKTGAKLFKKHCQQCHQSDGDGIPGVYPSLVGSKWVMADEKRLAAILLKGLQGPIMVKEELYDGSNAMPAFEDKLNDKQLAALICYIRSSWGNTCSSLTEEGTAAEVRSQLADYKEAFTVDTLSKFYPEQ